MLLALITGAVGVLVGALIARRRKGTTADVLQYAVVYALAFGLAGLFAAIIVTRIAG